MVFMLRIWQKYLESIAARQPFLFNTKSQPKLCTRNEKQIFIFSVKLGVMKLICKKKPLNGLMHWS